MNCLNMYILRTALHRKKNAEKHANTQETLVNAAHKSPLIEVTVAVTEQRLRDTGGVKCRVLVSGIEVTVGRVKFTSLKTKPSKHQTNKPK